VANLLRVPEIQLADLHQRIVGKRQLHSLLLTLLNQSPMAGSATRLNREEMILICRGERRSPFRG